MRDDVRQYVIQCNQLAESVRAALKRPANDFRGIDGDDAQAIRDAMDRLRRASR